MKVQHSVVIRNLARLSLILLAAYWATGAEKRTYVCSTANPQSTCAPGNTCGSASAPCHIDVRRTDYGAEAIPGIPGAKGNASFCVKVGTTIIWHSSSKNTGFTVDFGQAVPFEPAAAIIGGTDRTVSVVAKKPGCYKFTAGACNTEAIYGMCAEGSSDLIISDK
jgi:hypothetical protein